MRISESKLRRLIRRSIKEQMKRKRLQQEAMDPELMAKIVASVKGNLDSVMDVEEKQAERDKRRAELEKRGKQPRSKSQHPQFGTSEYEADFKKKYGKHRSPYS